MTVSLIRVRSLTWATVRPARWRASAKAAPMDTLRLHSSAAPRTAPATTRRDDPGPIISRDPRGGSAASFCPRRAAQSADHGTPIAFPGLGAECLRRCAWAGHCDASDQLHDLRGRNRRAARSRNTHRYRSPARARARRDRQASPRLDLPRAQTMLQVRPPSGWPRLPGRFHSSAPITTIGIEFVIVAGGPPTRPPEPVARRALRRRPVSPRGSARWR
jgi:hypothetical protein